MTEELKKIIEEELIKIPKEIREAIIALDWIKVSEEIGGKYLLNEEEINKFQAETFLILAGLTDPNFYATNVENQVGVTKDEAKKIVDEADQKIFTPIYNTLAENIKKSGKSKNADWQQNLDFILSGGDYSSFVENRNLATEVKVSEEEKVKIPIKPGGVGNIKDKLVI